MFKDDLSYYYIIILHTFNNNLTEEWDHTKFQGADHPIKRNVEFEVMIRAWQKGHVKCTVAQGEAY